MRSLLGILSFPSLDETSYSQPLSFWVAVDQSLVDVEGEKGKET